MASRALSHVAMMAPFWGRFTAHFRTYFSGDWDVHWGDDLDFDPWPCAKANLEPHAVKNSQQPPGAPPETGTSASAAKGLKVGKAFCSTDPKQPLLPRRSTWSQKGHLPKEYSSNNSWFLGVPC